MTEPEIPNAPTVTTESKPLSKGGRYYRAHAESEKTRKKEARRNAANAKFIASLPVTDPRSTESVMTNPSDL